MVESVYDGRIAVLCAAPESYYWKIPGLEIYDRQRDARNFSESLPVIAHPPCAQWSKLRAFAKVDPGEKDLAWFCFKKWVANGGIFEHPEGSSFFQEVKSLLPPGSRVYRVDQSDFGFPARKRTVLLFHKCMADSYPLPFEVRPLTKVEWMAYGKREKTTLSFDQWLVSSIRNSYAVH